jgi:hypothetical protein
LRARLFLKVWSGAVVRQNVFDRGARPGRLRGNVVETSFVETSFVEAVVVKPSPSNLSSSKLAVEPVGVGSSVARSTHGRSPS